MYLIFDTETTDKYDFKAAATAAHQPRIVQLGMVVLDEAFRTVTEYATLIQPDGSWKMASGAAAIHGITEESCTSYGVKIVTALSIMQKYAGHCKTVVGHNFRFDNNMLARECALATVHSPIRDLNSFCTMLSTTTMCNLPGNYGKPKWPKLQELHNHLFGHEFEGAHDAMADVKATARCFAEIATKYRDLVSFPKSAA